jgi:ATP-dependent protease ClpP protease subunit
VGIVDGYAASAASMVVLQAADHRIIRPNARILLHEVSRWAFGVERTSETEDSLNELRRVTHQIVAIIAARANRDVAEIEPLFHRREFWLSAQEAVDQSLADEVS